MNKQENHLAGLGEYLDEMNSRISDKGSNLTLSTTVDRIQLNNIQQMYQQAKHFKRLCQDTNLAQLSAKDENDFVCSTCRAYYLNNFYFTKKKCLLCQQNSEDLNLQHILEHKLDLLLCDMCDETFTNLETLQEHVKSEHNYMVYSCFCCEETFHLKYKIIWHLIDIHKHNKKNNFSKVIEYQCVSCKSNINKEDIKSHIINAVDHSQNIPVSDDIICMICKENIKFN